MNNLNKRAQSYLTRYVFLFICSVLYNLEANTSNFSLSGHADFTYISRLSDQSLINIPYRMVSLNIEKQADKISLNGKTLTFPEGKDRVVKDFIITSKMVE